MSAHGHEEQHGRVTDWSSPRQSPLPPIPSFLSRNHTTRQLDLPTYGMNYIAAWQKKGKTQYVSSPNHYDGRLNFTRVSKHACRKS